MSEIEKTEGIATILGQRSMRRVAAIMSGLGVAFSLGLVSSAAMADNETPIKNVTVDANRQLIVQFVKGAGAPQTPKIIEVKDPAHQLIVEFSNVTLEETVPAGDQLSRLLHSRMPGVRAARIGLVGNASTPSARLMLDLDDDLAIKPEITAVQDGVAVISLGDDYNNARSAAPAQTPVGEGDGGSGASASAAGSSNDPAAAYEEYYRKFLQQKQVVGQHSKIGEWGPRKGTVAEMKAAKANKGINVLANQANSAPDAEVAQAAPKRRAPASVVDEAADEQPTVDPAAEAKAEAAARAQAQARARKAAAAAASEAAEEIAVVPEKSAPVRASSTAQMPDMTADAPPISVEPQAARPKPKPKAKPVEVAEESAASADDASAARGSADEVAAMPAEGDDLGGGNESPRKRAIRVYNEAHKSHLAGHVEQAMAQYRQAIKIDPNLVEAHSDLGLALNQQHNYGSALVEFRKALAINPRDAYTYNGLGAALRAQHDNQAAIKNWEMAVKIDPRLAAAHYNLGTAYEAEGEYDRALVSYDEAVKNDQRFGEAYFRMGLILQQRHRYSDARVNFRKALRISADSDYAAEARTRIANLDKIIK